MGTKLVGDHLSRGIDFIGIICPVGKEVGDQKSGDQMGLGPNKSQPFYGVFRLFLQRSLTKLTMLFGGQVSFAVGALNGLTSFV